MRLLIILIGSVFLVTIGSGVARAVVDGSRLELNKFGLKKVHHEHPITKLDYKGPSVADRLKKIMDNKRLTTPQPVTPPAPLTDDSNKPLVGKEQPREEKHQPNGGTCSYCGSPYLDPAQARINMAAASESPEVDKQVCRYCGNILH